MIMLMSDKGEPHDVVYNTSNTFISLMKASTIAMCESSTHPTVFFL